MSFLTRTATMLGILKRSLGEDIRYQFKTGGTANIRAVWNKEQTIVDPDTETVVNIRDPNIGVQLSDLRKPPEEGDKVYFQDRKYKVVQVEEDGQGAAQLQLYELT